MLEFARVLVVSCGAKKQLVFSPCQLQQDDEAIFVFYDSDGLDRAILCVQDGISFRNGQWRILHGYNLAG